MRDINLLLLALAMGAVALLSLSRIANPQPRYQPVVYPVRTWLRDFSGVEVEEIRREGEMVTVTVIETRGVAVNEPPVGAEMTLHASKIYRH